MFPWNKSLCNRRQLLQSSVALGAYMLTGTPQLPAAPARGQAKGVILIMLQGGMSHLETWDPKPSAPAEVRGEFGTIPTTVPGLRVGEYMPRLAQRAHLFNVVRSVHCDARNDHSPGMHLLLTGWENTGAGVDLQRTNMHHPSQGSVIAQQLGASSPNGAARFVALARKTQIGGRVSYAGPAFLGPSCEAFETGEAPANCTAPMVIPPSLTFSGDLPLRRLQDRLALRHSFHQMNAALERHAALDRLDAQYQRALQVLTGQRMADALNLEREPLALREQYGNNRIGQSLLLARRLVECGVTYVLADAYGDMAWDTHAKNFITHRNLLPPMDHAVAALLTDLEQRGMLDDVLVVLASEMGRASVISGDAGRDHWTYAYSVMLAGGGLTRGQVLGSTTPRGDWPSSRPVAVPQIHATLYQQLGIDPNSLLRDELGRPIQILPEANAIHELIA